MKNKDSGSSLIREMAVKADEMILGSDGSESNFSEKLTEALSIDVLRVAVRAANRILAEDDESDDNKSDSLENRFKYLLASAEKVLEAVTLTDSQKNDLKNFLSLLPLYAVFKNKVERI